MDYDYVKTLEEKLACRSDGLEEIHLEAAIDAQLLPSTASPSSEVVGVANTASAEAHASSNELKNGAIFDDYMNPNAVANCLSPYVPSKSERIAAFLDFVGMSGPRNYDGADTTQDVLLDIGCGDGRVCIVTSKVTGCKSVGIDVSPPCIAMARQVAREEGLAEECHFFEADATLDPDLLLSDSSPLANALRSVTVVFLYTYPTLLVKLCPLLSRLLELNVRAVVTLTYHLSEEIAPPDKKDEANEFRLYTRISVGEL